MYTINIRGKQNPKDTKMVKLEIIFFKTGYARVPKVINITGLLKDWDVKSQSFRVGSAEATTKNKLLFDLRTKYLHVADTWEMEGRNWSPVQLSHCFDEIKAAKPEVKVKSVQQMIDYLEETFKNKKRIKNGQIVDSTTNAKRYVYLKRELQAFTKEKYEKAFSSYFFTDITEEFLLDFAFWLKERGIRNGNKAGLTHKLRLLRAVCRQAEKKEMYGVNMDNFLCLGDDINWPETTSRAVPETVIAKIANVDRTLFTKKEQLHLDLFLFSYYTGGMANVDVCNLTWDLVQEDRIVDEIFQIMNSFKPEGNLEICHQFFRSLCEYMKANKFLMIIIATPEAYDFVEKALTMFHRYVRLILEKSSKTGLAQEKYSYAVAYAIGGVVGILHKFAVDNCQESSDKMSAFLTEAFLDGMRPYLGV